MSKKSIELIKQRRRPHHYWRARSPESWHTESRKGMPFCACKAKSESSLAAHRAHCPGGDWVRESCSTLQQQDTLSAHHTPTAPCKTQGESKCSAPLPRWQGQDTGITPRHVSHSNVSSWFSMVLAH